MQNVTHLARPATNGRFLAWLGLVVGMGASMAANIASALPAWGPRLSAGVAPVLTVIAAGLLERAPLALARTWQKIAAWIGLSLVAVAAFVTSFLHQYRLLIGYGNPPVSAVLLPVAIDGLVVLASVCLAVIGEVRRVSDTVSDTEDKAPVNTVDLVARLRRENPGIGVAEMARLAEKSERTINRVLAKLAEQQEVAA